MAFATERKLIESYVDANWTSTPIKFDNVPFQQPRSAPFVSLSILSGSGSATTMGPDPVERYNGIIQFDVYVPENSGTEAARVIATEIRDLLRNKQLAGEDDEIITCRTPSLNRIAKSPTGHYRLSVTVPYSMDV